MDEAGAQAILGWRYEPPYDFYDLASEDAEAGLQTFLDPRNAYYTLTDEQGHLVAYCCFGPDAQVPGGDYSPDALDIGLGMRPDLTGKGRGLGLVTAIMDFAQHRFAARAFRVTVAAFNQRALRVYQKAGFRPVQTFRRSKDDVAFVLLMAEPEQ